MAYGGRIDQMYFHLHYSTDMPFDLHVGEFDCLTSIHHGLNHSTSFDHWTAVVLDWHDTGSLLICCIKNAQILSHNARELAL